MADALCTMRWHLPKKQKNRPVVDWSSSLSNGLQAMPTHDIYLDDGAGTGLTVAINIIALKQGKVNIYS